MEHPSTPLERAPYNVSKIAKFESDLLKSSEDIDPQSREILQTFVLWRAQTCSLSSNLKIGVPHGEMG